jgi:hypothetical protein
MARWNDLIADSSWVSVELSRPAKYRKKMLRRRKRIQLKAIKVGQRDVPVGVAVKVVVENVSCGWYVDAPDPASKSSVANRGAPERECAQR